MQQDTKLASNTKHSQYCKTPSVFESTISVRKTSSLEDGLGICALFVFQGPFYFATLMQVQLLTEYQKNKTHNPTPNTNCRYLKSPGRSNMFQYHFKISPQNGLSSWSPTQVMILPASLPSRLSLKLLSKTPLAVVF